MKPLHLPKIAALDLTYPDKFFRAYDTVDWYRAEMRLERRRVNVGLRPRTHDQIIARSLHHSFAAPDTSPPFDPTDYMDQWRELTIARDFKEGRRIDALFPDTFGATLAPNLSAGRGG